MLKLRAVAYEDGYAVYQEGDRIYMIRPPYEARTKTLADEAAVGRAITAYDYAASDLEFEGISELIAHLNAQFVAARRASGQPELSEEEVRRFVQSMSATEVCQDLDAIETEMMPNHEWDAAIHLLTDLLGNTSVLTENSLFRRCAELFTRCQSAKGQRGVVQRQFIEDVDFRARFPHVPNNAIDLRDDVQRRGHILDMGFGTTPYMKAA